MKKKALVVGIWLLCVVMVCLSGYEETQTEKAPAEKTTKTADIQTENGVFAITPEECVTLLNADIEKENLPLIPEKFKKETLDVVLDDGQDGIIDSDDKGKRVTTYTYQIDDSISLIFRAFPDENNGIPVIEIVQEDNGATLSNKDFQRAKAYFDLICKNVAPEFNSADFKLQYTANHAEFGNLFFWCQYMNEQKDETQGTLRVYLVTTNTDLFGYYI